MTISVVIRFSVIFLGAVFYFSLNSFSAEATTMVSGQLTVDTVWTKANSPYIATEVSVPFGKTLTIEPGVHVKLNGIIPLYSFGTINIGGEGEEVIMTSYSDDVVDGDTNQDGDATQPSVFDWCSIGVHSNAVLNITNTSIRYGGCAARGQLHNLGGTLTVNKSNLLDSGGYGVLASGFTTTTTTVTDTEISGANIGVRYHGGNLILKNNSIHGNREYGMLNSSLAHTIVDAANNWWGSDKGPFHATNPGGIGNNAVSNYILFDPWLGQDPLNKFDLCTENCFSNVLFLPGIKTSRLYTVGTNGAEDELWVPNYYGNDVDELYLDEYGKSANSIYAKDGGIMEETPVGGNLYKTFLAQLAGMKAAQTINDYSAFAYDWRQSVEDIAKNGTLYQEGVRSAIATLEGLSNTSKSNKVTIIAHSNGGLLAKAIMMELESQGKEDKVDRIVFVGSPQMGTPFSILSALYGYDEETPLDVLIPQSKARKLIENMPGAYGLLPSAEYFNRMSDPFITFNSENTRYKSFKDAYGEKIQSFDEFKKFLLGTDDNREKPSENDVEQENILNKNILQEASEIHTRIDNWIPPENVEVVQIAGWGLDTISGVKYSEKEKTKCFGLLRTLACKGTGEYEPVYDPVFTVDGDKVVVSPSALMIPEATNVKKYWVDLFGYSQQKLVIDREHKDLLEVVPVVEFITGTIIDNNEVLPKYILPQRPDISNGHSSRLRMSLYSPLDIHLYDSHGNHTGPKTVVIDGQEATIFEEGIPNSYYFQFGDRKYVGFDETEAINVKMDGYADGSYTLKLEEVKISDSGDEIVAHSTFENLPTTSETEVNFDVPVSGLADMSRLEADVNGDDRIDYELEPVLNGSVTIIPDTTAPLTDISISGMEGNNSWYISDVSVMFTAQDEEKGSGVEKTEYSLDNGTTWENYDNPFVLSQEGSTKIIYASTDVAGNREETKMRVIKIDKTVPRLTVSFDPVSKKLFSTGDDYASSTTFVSDTNGATVTDEAGHSASATFTGYNAAGKETKVTLSSIAKDSERTPFSNATLSYEWSLEKNGSLKMLNETATLDNTSVHAHYLSKDNKTKIEKTEGTTETLETRSGMTILKFLIEDGKVKIKY